MPDKDLQIKMTDKKAESSQKSVLEIILEFGHKAILKDEVVKVK